MKSGLQWAFILSTVCISVINSEDQKSTLRKKYFELIDPLSATKRKEISPKVKEIIGDLSDIAKLCPPSGFFYSFHPGHREAIIKISKILKSITDPILLLDAAFALRQSPHIHPHLWFYATSTVFIKRRELGFIPKVKPHDGLPDLFFPAEALKRARSPSDRQRAEGCIQIDETFTQGTNSKENKLWYYRESLGVNSHHWFWHTLYDLANGTQPPEKAENRRGELFYFMHAQLLARYNAERLSNGLPRAVALEPKLSIPLPGYISNLGDDNSNASWTSRAEGAAWKDVNFFNYGLVKIVNNLTIPLARVREGIKNGKFEFVNKTEAPLRTFDGIDILGNAVESSGYSINREAYGTIHNLGHITIGLVMDPTNTQRPGVMSDSAGAMRDPIFYEWHSMIQEIFDIHLRSLPPHQPVGGDFPLLWKGITVDSIKVELSGTVSKKSSGQLETFWRRRKVKLTIGLDLGKISAAGDKTLDVCLKELDHKPFHYEIKVTNNQKSAMPATVRIYMAPKYDENNRPFTLSEQRQLFIVLDVFETELKVGQNLIIRQSIDSQLTVPYDDVISTINAKDDNKNRVYCGCGYPNNLLIPKGTAKGMSFDLFVMLTNGAEDRIVQDKELQSSCIVKPILCGAAHQKYPDAKPMFYPFNTIPYHKNGKLVERIQDFVDGISNMKTIEVKIVSSEDEIDPTDTFFELIYNRKNKEKRNVFPMYLATDFKMVT